MMFLSGRLMKIVLLKAVGAILLVQSGWSADYTTINVLNDSTTLLRDSSGLALSSGATGNSNGALVQLGYYSTSTTGNNFSGIWVPLTSFGLSAKTTIGDSQTGINRADGRIGFVFNFAFGTSDVLVYDPQANAGAFVTSSQNVISSSSPAANQILSLRFYDSNAGNGSFNAVSSNSWTWQAPSPLSNLSFNLADSGTALVWQDASNSFKTTIAVPEPSALGMAFLGFGSFFLSQRHRWVKVA